MAVARLKLANPQPLVRLEYHKYQHAFMEARRLRVCTRGHEWSALQYPSAATCPHCQTDRVARAYWAFLLRAGRRGGKTRIGALSVIEELAPINQLWWACAPTYPKLNDYVLPAFFKQIPQAWLDHPDTDWSESELSLVLPHRSQCQFRSLEDPDRGRGPGLNGVWIDEICELTLTHWETIEPALADQSGILIATTSPKGPDWVHDTFYVPAEMGQPGFWACAFTTLDNPFIKPEMVARARARMTPLMFRQEYLAEIVTFTGAVYGDMVEACIIEGTDEEMRYYFPEWPMLDPTRADVCGLDPGTEHPFGGVELVASPRGLVCVDEYLEANKVYAIHSAGLKLMRKGFTGRAGIDRSQAQAQIELTQYGVYTVPAENDVISGINRVSAWMLASAQHVVLTDLVQKPKLPAGLVLPRRFCPKLIKQLQAYRWAENSTGKQGISRELVFKKNDDLCDALRYGLMTYPVLPTADPEAGSGKRDLRGLPQDVRLQIERERRSMKTQEPGDEDLVEMDGELVPLTGMGDFSA
jgi:hypothetical protein